MLSFNMLVKMMCLLLFLPILFSNIKLKKSFRRIIIVALFYIYLCLVACFVYFPIPIDLTIFRKYSSDYFSYNVIPFNFIIELLTTSNKFRMQLVYQVIGNIILFVPFGFLVPLISLKYAKFTQAIISGVITSSLIEISQLGLDLLLVKSYRVIDIDDIILNSFGTICGFLIFSIVQRLLTKKLSINLFELTS